ncbi:MAG: helix-hairpin-helix domain-containing protein, partial [Bacteroidetes bacterium]
MQLVAIKYSFTGFLSPLLFCGFLILPELFYGQQEETPPTVQPPEQIVEDDDFHQRVESLIEESDEEIDATELIEELELLRQRPLNLNAASADDLRRIFFLNDIQINNLIEHRNRFGNLISMMELQAIDGFDLETIRRIQPFVTVSEVVERRRFNISDILERGNSQYFLRYQQLFEEQRGFSPIDPEDLEANPNARYLGSPYRLYSRYRFSYYNNLSIGITAEKDPGEEFFQGSQPYGFDFYSAHFYLRDAGRI